MFNRIVIHYGEIGIKGKNRDIFENKLMQNIQKILKDARVYKQYGKIIADVDNIDIDPTKQKLKLLPGIAYFAFAVKSELDVEAMKSVAESLLKEDFKTFGINAKRSSKKFELTSKQINEQLGEYISKKFNKKVNLDNPDLTVFVEVSESEAYVYTKKIYGVGGLPTTSSGKVICSLSGGIDSPVAAFMMMKRGCEAVFVHTLNRTAVGDGAVLSKLDNIVKELTKIQIKSKLYVVPFEDIQKQIIMNVPAKYRMIVYRRFMTKIANKIANKEKARAIVTGDNVGQVASQTIENLNCIYNASELPVLAPLVGLNKEEIILLAKKINTFDYSVQPYPDCCSYMIAKHPEIKGKLEQIQELEKNIENSDVLIEESIKKSEIKNFKL